MGKKNIRIILCKGDMDELKEITGFDYKYLHFNVPITNNNYYNWSFEAYHKSRRNEVSELLVRDIGENIPKALNNLYGTLRFVGADAVIHYETYFLPRLSLINRHHSDESGVMVSDVPVKLIKTSSKKNIKPNSP